MIIFAKKCIHFNYDSKIKIEIKLIHFNTVRQTRILKTFEFSLASDNLEQTNTTKLRQPISKIEVNLIPYDAWKLRTDELYLIP